MGLHLVPVVAKLHLLSSPSHTLTTPFLAALICPFVLKLSFSLRVIRRVSIDAVDAFRLFLFQLGQIAFEAHHHQHQPAAAAPPPPNINGDRWQRALRLVCERIIHVRRSAAGQSDDEDDRFHTLTILSL